MTLKNRLLGIAIVLCASAAAAADDTRVIDDFSDTTAWRAGGSDQVQARVVRGGPRGGLCLRYDFGRVSGYAVLRRALPLELPPHYALALRLRGNGPPNALQIKLVDASGDNVWWLNRPDYVPPQKSTELLIRQRQIEFAWGPTSDRVLRRAAGLELVIASGSGGRGELCFERLTLRTLPAPGPTPPAVAGATSTGGGNGGAAAAIDDDVATAWRSTTGRTQHWQVDYGQARELNGVLLRFADGARASDLELQFSDDGKQWRSVRRLQNNTRDVLALWLPDSETRHLRLQMRRGPKANYAIAEVQAMGPHDWPRLNSALSSLAHALPRGRLPRGFVGEQNYWTLVGVDGGARHAALISEDGAIEPRRGGPSIEPFVFDEGGRVISFADTKVEQALRDGDLPLPQVRWSADGFTLTVDAGADGDRNTPELIARYTLTNTSARARTLNLALALRPWQVNAPTQFLNTPGGVSVVRQLAWRDGVLHVDKRAWAKPLTAPAAVGAAAYDHGDAVELAAQGQLPSLSSLDDPQGLASAVLRWPVALAPGESRSIALVLPLADRAPRADRRDAQARLDASAQTWRRRLGPVTLNLPPAAQPLVNTLRSSHAHILLSRDGAALQPGTRSYARSWVRDGAMMVAGLLRLGEVQAAREFVQWYAGHLFASGKVPCCVDARGADPVAENDSHGQFIFSVAQLWQYTRERALVEAMWPKVDAAVRYMESLRQSERTPANRQPGQEAYFGLMPASISHEGYSAKPMHSYWDDFWALAGYRDAVRLAQLLGHHDRAREIARQHDEFRTELGASLAAAVARHRIDFLPGAAELGDYDPTSSTTIFSPAGAETLVARPLLEATWERYWNESVQRNDGKRDWNDYTPYELRSVSAFVRLGQPQRAHAMLDFFLRDRRPVAWNQWAEVVGRLPREPRFVGDMPHAWISSDYIRSVLDLLAYERESDGALVLGAGVPPAWWREAPVEVKDLRTPFGPLSFRLAREGNDTLRVTVASGLERPPGGLWFAWAGTGAPPPTTADGRTLQWDGKLLKLPDGAVDLRLKLGAGDGVR